MEQFRETDSAVVRLDAGYRTEGALDRSVWTDLAATVTDANEKLLVVDRAWQDARRPVAKAYGARDLVLLELRGTARKVRMRLLAGGPELARQQPYTDILPKGLTEYTEAKIGEIPFWFGRLADRIVEYLPADHPVRIELVPVLRGLVRQWTEALARLDRTRWSLDKARRARVVGIAAWDATMLEVYGLLLPLAGKDTADEIVGRRRSTSREIDAPPADAPPAEAEAASDAPVVDG